MILERFNAIVFVGDYISQSVYAAFNILLREDLALGALQQGTMDQQAVANCKCDNQFNSKSCLEFAIKDMEDVKNTVGNGNAYFCRRIYPTVQATACANGRS